jgi:CDP-diacylglycerol--glycerol-3-phosphate 3-phosphatidyltransferase
VNLLFNRANLANWVTMSRIVAAPLFLILIFSANYWDKWIAGGLFAWGALSDYLDGYLARKYRIQSNFGIFMDPLADKVLLLSAMVALVQMNMIPAWMVIIIATREFVITGLRQLAQTKNILIKASRGGKHKTVSQIIAISVALVIVCLKASPQWMLYKLSGIIQWIQQPQLLPWILRRGPYFLMLYATVASVVSGVDYLIKNQQIIRGKLK